MVVFQEDICKDLIRISRLSSAAGLAETGGTNMKLSRKGMAIGSLVLYSLLGSCSQQQPMSIPQVSRDQQTEIERYQTRLDSTLHFLEVDGHRFAVDGSDQFRMPDEQARQDLVALWASFHDYMAHLDHIRLASRGYYQKLGDEIEFDLFIAYYQVFLIQSTRALHFIQIIDRNQALSTIMDEAHEEYGLGRNTYSVFKSYFLNVKQTGEYAALRTIYRNQRPEINPYYSRIAMLEGYANSLGWDYGVKLGAKHATEVIGDQSYSWWFPIQKEVANWAGHTRLFRQGEALLTAEDIAHIQSQLQPGDILFQRREWYMTNAGIPGYWTHAALYVGSPDERTLFFDDDSVRAWVRQQGIASGSFEELLGIKFPDAYVSHSSRDEFLNQKTVLEAISPGVVFQTLSKSLSCDGLGVVRPRLSKAHLAAAIATAFQYHGRGYDYNFDFLTDSTLVCSELIYKTFLPGAEQPGIAFKTEKIAGRLLTPANKMVKQFDQEMDSLGLEFVLFYDGDELEKVSRKSDLEQFRKTWRRLDIYPLVPAESLLLKR